MPEVEGDAPMSEMERGDARLRRAFQSLGETHTTECSAEDRDRVWQAVRGELPAAERRAIVARLAVEPALAEAWRVASEVWRASQEAQAASRPLHATGTEVRRAGWFWSPAWMGAAAAVSVVVTGALAAWLLRTPPGDELRAPADSAVESRLPPDTALPRDAFALAWTAGAAGSRYDLRVTTEELRTLATAADLEEPSFVVPAAALAGLASGTRILWQVDAVTPDGERISSQTFVTPLQ
jgi:hypothetical protein